MGKSHFQFNQFFYLDLWVACVAYLSIRFQIVELVQGQGFRFIFPTDCLLSKCSGFKAVMYFGQ